MGMEIERKWMVQGWPEGYPLRKEEEMRQGYVSVRPTVRIREEKLRVSGGGAPLKDEFILGFKSKGRLSRKEIEFPIEEARFRELEDLIGLPLIPKLRRTYLLPGGHQLEVNHVDEGAPTEFWYAEVLLTDTTKSILKKINPKCAIEQIGDTTLSSAWIAAMSNGQQPSAPEDYIEVEK